MLLDRRVRAGGERMRGDAENGGKGEIDGKAGEERRERFYVTPGPVFVSQL